MYDFVWSGHDLYTAKEKDEKTAANRKGDFALYNT